ncbi:MAG: polysaccharide deacetylase family protein [Rhodospirillales bacterium]|nr:polysaccharide deacetylase family protein [Rhodospirillales bacterium]
MASWQNLDRELKNWHQNGRAATLWWRDDDAVDATPQLDALLNLSGRHHIPVVVAAIPFGATDDLRRRLRDETLCAVIQHGFRHANHAPPGEKKAEFGPHRDKGEMIGEIIRGSEQMKGFGNFWPALAAPWNRFDQNLCARLPEAGLRALSTFGPRKTAEPAPGLRQVNTHVDPVSWRGGRVFAGTEAVLDQLIGHLSARRLGRVDRNEPTGILTHHLVCDEAGWDFLDSLFQRLRDHPGAAFLGAEEALRQ